jgi:hypothetical protein
MPVWTYHVRDLVIEKRVLMPHLQNTVTRQLPDYRRWEGTATRAEAGVSLPPS